MDISGFSSRNEGTTENIPRRWGNADSLPSLSQLKLLYEEALEAESQPQPEERFEAAEEPVVNKAAAALKADIPSLDQLRALRDEERFSPAERQPSVSRGNSTSGVQPVRRVPASQRKKTAAKPVLVAVKTKEVKREVSPQAKRVQPAVQARQPEEKIPTLSQLQQLREELETEPRTSARVQTQDVIPARNANPDRFPDRIPSLSQLVKLRDTVSRETSDKWDQLVPDQQMPVAPLKKVLCDTSDVDALPTLAQLKSLLAEEKQYGNLAFQENVRQVRQNLAETSPRVAAPEKSAPQAPVARETATSPRVHFIPYEEFNPEEEFESFSVSDKKEDAARPQSDMRSEKHADAVPEAEPLYPKPEKLTLPEEEPAENEKRRRRKKKRQTMGTSRVPFLSSFLLRNN